MKLTAQLGTFVLLTSTVLPRAFAAPVTYTLTGYVQANAAGPRVNTSFTWTVVADTAGITSPAPGRFQSPATSSSIAFGGAGTATLTSTNVVLNTSTGQVSFSTASGGLGLTSSQLQTWDLASLIGPVDGTNLMAGFLTTSTGTIITVTGVANTNNGPSPTFQAALPSPTVRAWSTRPATSCRVCLMQASLKAPSSWPSEAVSVQTTFPSLRLRFRPPT